MDLQGFGHLLIAGMWVTVKLAITSLFFGLILGILGAAAKTSKSKFLRFLGGVYTSIIRGLPELLLVLIIYYGTAALLLKITGEYVEIGGFTAGVFALSLAFGAYATEVFRAAILELHKGQAEAAFALGLNKKQSFFLIELPQLWRITLPGLGNLFLVLLKDTALVSLISLNDIMRQAANAVNATKLPFTFYSAASILYLVLTIISMLVIHYLIKMTQPKNMEAK